jgi:hypothetical protein
MLDAKVSSFSRRKWMEGVTTPAAAATMGCVLSAVGSASEPNNTPEATLGARVYNIRDYGAKGDGRTLDTAAVQKAVDACHKEKGGTVLVPSGDFVVGTVELKSNVTLHLAATGRLLGSGRGEDYVAGRGVPRDNGNIVLLYAVDAENITIEGRGTVDGHGNKFFTGRGDNTGPGEDPSLGYDKRPHLAVFYHCRNLLIRDTYFTRSAYHCLRFLECRYVRLDGVRIHNRVNFNNDGFHFDGSQYVNIANCNIACQDDACALFGDCRFITVTNSTFSTRWSVFRFGNGSPENVTVSNCLIYETYGCPIKMHFGPDSRAQNLHFSNLILNDVTGPISINRSGGPSDASKAKGFVRKITFSNIQATVVTQGQGFADMAFEFPQNYYRGETRQCIVVNGTGDGGVEDIAFHDVRVTYGGGGMMEEAQREVPQVAGEYFEIGTPPAYGLYARNVRGLTLSNVRFDVVQPDLRPAVVLDHVTDCGMSGLSAMGNKEAKATLRFVETQDVLITAPRLLTPGAVFLRVEGDGSHGVTIDGGDITKATTAVAFGSGAGGESVRVRG